VRTDPEPLVNTLGSYLGKCIIETYGGAWARAEAAGCVAFKADNKAMPFAKIEKHLTNGREDSCLSFFKVIQVVFENVLDA
jgi:hypothetical protein